MLGHIHEFCQNCDPSIYPWMCVPATGKNSTSSSILNINENFTGSLKFGLSGRAICDATTFFYPFWGY